MKSLPLARGYVPHALEFERVMENNTISARHSRLLTLPVEILSLVIGYISGDSDTLANLALVNSDCRQISRSYQFCSIVIDYRYDRVKAFLQALLRESEQRSQHRSTRHPSLAACVRRISISTRFPNTDPSNLTSKVHPASDVSKIHEAHLGVISLLYSMPNLETLEFCGCRFVLHYLLGSISNATVTALKCHGETCCKGQNLSVGTACISSDREPLEPLAHLDIAIDSMLASSKFVCGQDFVFTNLLDKCASSLESLKISHNFSSARLSLASHFSQLRSLHVVKGSLLDSRSWCSLFRCRRLSTLAVDFSDDVLRKSFVEMSPHMTLEVLVLYTINSSPDASLLQILKNNINLEALYIGGELPPDFINLLLSKLAGLPNLRLLSMTWSGSEITDSSLVALSTLKFLQQLHISTGLQHGTWYNWVVDHEALLLSLSPLKHLRRIIFTRDSYVLDNGASMISAGGYYIHRLPERSQWLRAIRNGLSYETVQEIWEGQHRYRMTDYAQRYAQTFKKLESIHIGQLTFDIIDHDGKRTAMLRNPHRCEDFQVVENLFEIL